MRAISLWQPWASAIALGAKRIETRDWPTHVRGQIAIHAAKRKVQHEWIEHGCSYNWCAALDHAMGAEVRLEDKLPFGAIVAVCELVDCKPTGAFTLQEVEDRRTRRFGSIYTWTERQMGNFALGRYGWVLANVRALATPIPFKAKQGFFEVPDELIDAALSSAPSPHLSIL